MYNVHEQWHIKCRIAVRCPSTSHVKLFYFEFSVRHMMCIFSYFDHNPQRMRLQRQLYGFYTVIFLIVLVPWNCKLVSFFAKSLNKPVKDFIQGRRPKLTLKLPYLKYVKSSLRSHPLGETLCNDLKAEFSYLKYIFLNDS